MNPEALLALAGTILTFTGLFWLVVAHRASTNARANEAQARTFYIEATKFYEEARRMLRDAGDMYDKCYPEEPKDKP